jgi:hypothetical protein
MDTSLAGSETDRALDDWASLLGCTAEEVRSAMGEAGRLLFEQAPSEQFELDLALRLSKS